MTSPEAISAGVTSSAATPLGLRSGVQPSVKVRIKASSAWAVLLGGAIGLIASMSLTAEKIHVLADPTHVPACNLSPVLSCGSVMTTPEAEFLGLPNSLFGVIAFSIIVVTGVLAVGGVMLPRWYWLGLTAGLLAGAGFVHRLIFVSLYRTGALCPYCMVVWAVTIPLLVVVSGGLISERSGTAAMLVHRWRWSLTAMWFVVVATLVFLRFQDYWLTLIYRTT